MHFLFISLTFQMDSKSRLFCETITSWLITWGRRAENTDCFSGLHLTLTPWGWAKAILKEENARRLKTRLKILQHS